MLHHILLFGALMTAVLFCCWWTTARDGKQGAAVEHDDEDQCMCCCDDNGTPPYTRSAERPRRDFKQQILDEGFERMSVESLEAILQTKKAQQTRARAAVDARIPHVGGNLMLNDLR